LVEEEEEEEKVVVRGAGAEKRDGDSWRAGAKD